MTRFDIIRRGNCLAVQPRQAIFEALHTFLFILIRSNLWYRRDQYINISSYCTWSVNLHRKWSNWPWVVCIVLRNGLEPRGHQAISYSICVLGLYCVLWINYYIGIGSRGPPEADVTSARFWKQSENNVSLDTISITSPHCFK